MKAATRNVRELDTPCLILDTEILERNLRRMQDVVMRAGKALRPHAKTHKCTALARRQIEVGAIGVCAAKVSEAEALVEAGLHGIHITGPVATPAKIRKLVRLLAASPSLTTVVDDRSGADLLDGALREKGMSMDVLLDVDVGMHRTGAKPADAPGLAEYILSRPALRLRGIQAYAGHVQQVRSFPDRQAASHQCLRDAVSLFRDLRATADTCSIFSASGTGTFDIDLEVPEITELQVGSYACMDAEYLAIGSAEDPARFAPFGPALRLLTTVVSGNQPGFVTVDAGLKSLYKDGGVPQVVGERKRGLTYDWFGDEYGRVSYSGEAEAPAVGTVLELVVSHCDPTVNLFDRYYLTKGDDVVGEWPIDLRGRSQ
jgi:D-serine deaminase-like pyridoxal phosphate-dependent protein